MRIVMAAEFNPYHVWLGIPPDDQPANHYRLLGLRVFETNADVIESAADRQMAHLRTFQGGKHGEMTQRLLNEVAAARICLLDPKKRAAYDERLRAALPVAASGPVAVVPLPEPVVAWDELLGNSAAKPAIRRLAKPSNPIAAESATAKRTPKNRLIALAAAGALVLVAAVGFGVYSLSGSSDGTLVFDWHDSERASCSVSVDGTALALPMNGRWEYRCPAGSHHIVASRPAFKLDTNVTVAAGQEQLVPPDWKAKAVLVLNWPPALREGAELKVDDRIQSASQREPLEVPVDPGKHLIRITRTGAAPIEAAATVAAGGRELVAIALPPINAKIVLDWPAEERKGAQLTIDGQSRTVPLGSDSEPLELTLEPGEHVVHITRPGFEPFNETVALAPGASIPLKPTWTPEHKPDAGAPTSSAPQASTPVAPNAPTVAAAVATPAKFVAQPVKKLAVPADAEQERIGKQLDDRYKISRAALRNPDKAQELYRAAANDGNSPGERYMLLTKGAEIAAAAGDLDLSLQGVNTLEAEYEIDALKVKQRLLEKLVNAGRTDQVAMAIPAAEQFLDQAIAADRYDVALGFATIASHAAVKSQIVTRKEIEERLSRRRRDIHLLEPSYAAAKESQATLDKNPADAEANLAVGRWRCLYKGDWAAGLPLLAKGSDEKLKPVAAEELKARTDADRQAQLADAWWELGQKEAGIVRGSFRLHAAEIYRLAAPNLTSALKKAAIEKRLAEIADLKPISAPAAFDPSKSAGAINLPLRQWVDVLRLIDTTSDVVAGTWSRQGGRIDVAPGSAARIAIPVAIDGGYDLEIDFTRTSGESDVAAMLPIGSHACMATLSGRAGADSGIANVDGLDPTDSRNPTAVRPGHLDNGRRYRLFISTRILAENRASIDVALDGKRYLPHWEGNPAALGYNATWSMPNPKRLGLGAEQSEVTFHSARLRMVSGHALADPASDLAAKSRRPTILSARWGNGDTWADVTPLVREAVAKGETVLANTDFLKSDPINGTVKQLQIAYEKSGTKETANIDEGGKWSKDDYETPTILPKPALGQGIDLLANVDTDHDTAAGHWRRHGNALVSDDHFSKFVFPTEIDAASYEMRVELSRDQGNDCVALSFPVGDRGCSFTLSNFQSRFSGLEMLDGRRAGDKDNPTAHSPSMLIFGQRYVARVVVKVENENAQIHCFLDDKELVAWTGKVASLGYYDGWRVPPHRAGMAEFESRTTIYSARLLK
jgi:hypothetical protein